MQFVTGDSVLIMIGVIILASQVWRGISTIRNAITGDLTVRMDSFGKGQEKLFECVHQLRADANANHAESRHSDELIRKDIANMDTRLNGRIKRLEEDRSTFLAK